MQEVDEGDQRRKRRKKTKEPVEPFRNWGELTGGATAYIQMNAALENKNKETKKARAMKAKIARRLLRTMEKTGKHIVPDIRVGDGLWSVECVVSEGKMKWEEATLIEGYMRRFGWPVEMATQVYNFEHDNPDKSIRTTLKIHKYPVRVMDPNDLANI